MMFNISIKEASKMRYMGEKIKACYKAPNGVPFVKYFMRKSELEEFNKKASLAGSSLVCVMELAGGESKLV